MKEFYINDDGIRLHAKLDMPVGYEEGAKCPLVIVIHGITGHMEERHIVAVAQLLNEMGFATLRAEMYGHGKSDGEFDNHNLFKWLNNATAVTDYAKSLDFVTDLFFCGHSQGGVTTMMIGGMKTDDFKAILPLSPGSMITGGARRGELLGIQFDPEHVPDRLVMGAGMSINGNYVRAAQMLDLDWAIKQYKGPVFIVHGDEDEAIPVHYSEEAAAKYENAELVIIHGDDHCYNYHLDQVLDAIRNFMKQFI